MPRDVRSSPACSNNNQGADATPCQVGQGRLEVKTSILETKDGLQLYVEYWPATPGKETSGKEVVPVVLLHMAKGSGADWKSLAESLHRAGHAVIVPDLRGHGKSTQIKRGGRAISIDQATMRKADYDAMITVDMERIKKFIIDENNEQKLNLRKLCVVGAELGAAVAVNWAALDWSWPPLATGPQGQDVSGLVLLTPIWGYKGMSIVNATQQPSVQRSIATMIIVGSKDTANFNEARRLHQILERFHEDLSKAPVNVRQEKQDLFFITPPTSLQGTKMLGEKTLGVERAVQEFIQLRLVKQNIPWAKRDRPLE